MIPLSAFLVFAAILFAISLVGILLNQRNLITILMCVELMLLAVNTNFVAFAHFLNDINGEIFVEICSNCSNIMRLVSILKLEENFANAKRK